MLTDISNFKISDVTINYPKLDKPVNPFGQEQYELQIATADEAKVQELEENYISFRRKDGKLVKDANGMFTAGLKRKAHKANGETNGKVRVVTADLTPVDDVKSIGNGSKANVIVFQYPYDTAGRKGTGTSLTAIQITDMVVWSPSGGVDFEAVGSVEPAEVQGSTNDLF